MIFSASAGTQRSVPGRQSQSLPRSERNYNRRQEVDFLAQVVVIFSNFPLTMSPEKRNDGWIRHLCFSLDLFFLGFRTFSVIYVVVPLCRNNHLVTTLPEPGCHAAIFGEHCELSPHFTAHRAWPGNELTPTRDCEEPSTSKCAWTH